MSPTWATDVHFEAPCKSLDWTGPKLLLLLTVLRILSEPEVTRCTTAVLGRQNGLWGPWRKA